MFVRCEDGLVVVPSPSLYLVSGVLQRHEPVQVQTFIPETSVAELEMRIVRRRTVTRIIQFDLVEARPRVQCPGDKLRLIIDLDSLRQPAGCLDFFALVVDLFALNGFVNVEGKALPAERIQNHQRPKTASIVHLIGYEVHIQHSFTVDVNPFSRAINADLLSAGGFYHAQSFPSVQSANP